ncbi:TPA: recombinase family protein [Corynebacterium striatum]|nr:recombinase family protein [Corynebacterium striatum]HAT1199733.1 recombinase family protein [Corynebacterium striatum]HAT1213335.1 recombinase family protein [Corynebacterium striatum]HAT1282101.1 recombinase family protein [Corynebacterium striatum]HAT1341305.1 recombinase family protein [Corynebacterium striatum]
MSKRAVIYARISLDRLGEGLGVERQVDGARRYAQALGYEVAGEFVDNSVSAYNRTAVRPEYDRMVERLKGGDIDVIIVYHIDRLIRSTQALLDLFQVLEDHGAKVIATDGGGVDPHTADGRIMATILAAIAEYESAHKADRIRTAMFYKAKNGQVNQNGRRIFGYDYDGNSLKIREEEAEEIRWAAEYLFNGGTLYGVAKTWNQKGIRTTLGNNWIPAGVRALMLNPKIAGQSTWNPTVNEIRLLKNRKIAGEGEWEPIIDLPTWELLRVKLTDPARRKNKGAGPKPKYLGTGLYRCACGNTLNCGFRAYRDGRKVRIYTCRVRRDGRGDGVTKHSARNADPLDAYVTEILLQRLERTDFTELFLSENDGTKDEAAEIVSRLDRLSAEEESLARLSREEGVDARMDFFVSQLREIAAEREVLSERLDALQFEDSPLGAMAMVPDFRQWWSEADLDIRRSLLNAMMEVKVKPARRGTKGFHPEFVEIKWKI